MKRESGLLYSKFKLSVLILIIGSAVLYYVLLNTQSVVAKRKIANISRSISFESDVDQLFQSLKKNKVTNINEAVYLLDSDFFKMNNYALVYSSRSIQPGTLENPRVILVGKNGHLSLAFNHKLGTKKDLEVLQWRQVSKKWELFEIEFNKKGPVISQKNPKRCVSCHGQDPRPNWDTYPVWAGVYGSSEQLYSPGSEKNAWVKFKAKMGNDSVYSRLDISSGYGQANELLSLNMASEFINKKYSNLNVQRIARIVNSTVRQKQLVYPLLAVTAGCRNIKNFFNEQEFNKLVDENFSKYKKAGIRGYNRMLARQGMLDLKSVRDFVSMKRAPIYGYADHDLANTRYISEIASILDYFEGYVVEDWSHSFVERDVGFMNSSSLTVWMNPWVHIKDKNYLSNPIIGLYESLIKEFNIKGVPDMPPLMEDKRIARQAFCKSLVGKFKAFSVPEPANVTLPARASIFITDFKISNELGSKRLLQKEEARGLVNLRCSECHSSVAYVDGPPLPLNNLTKLSRYKNGKVMELLRTHNMPTSKAKLVMSEKERMQLIDYLEELYVNNFYIEFIKGNEEKLNELESYDY